MYKFVILTLIVIINFEFIGSAQSIYEADVNFRIDPGSKTCFFEKGKAGQVMEVYYQVLDGQHGELDISFSIIDPNAAHILTDHKKSQNSIIMDLEVDGDYAFCLDNTYSLINSKLVFVYVVMEDKKDDTEDKEHEETVAAVDTDGQEQEEEEILEWTGTDEDGEVYYIEVVDIAASLSRTLRHVIKARQMLDIYGAAKSRDSYMLFEDTFLVDMWSGVQISCMIVVGMVQVYMIKKLFVKPVDGYKSMF